MESCLIPWQVDAYVSGALTDELKKRLETHLTRCDVCRKRIEFRKADEQLFEELRDAEQLDASAPTGSQSATDRPWNTDHLRPAAVGTEVTQARPTSMADHPQRIGRYRILDVLGEGGMGIVYLAEQTEPIRRRVALKIIKLGMDTRRVIARFEAERQALAIMDHPNIAKVFDAGATELGRPYFVMEYVAGVPITDYCDEHRLNLRQRLRLFARVCQAIHHAHQKGLIHRDIKPTNILVLSHGDKAVPKVIDFGVAKALHQRLSEKTVYTALGQIIGTPDYMSPEQAEMTGRDIDTRSDIYSLGVLLYELLTGTRPFQTTALRHAPFADIIRAIREVEPPRPSLRLRTRTAADRQKPSSGGSGPSPGRLASDRSSSRGSGEAEVDGDGRRTERKAFFRQVRGDLDWITMKCLEKDRARRYASADALAADIRRYLDHQPVMARRPSYTYHFSKFVRRQRLPLAVATVLAIALMLTTYYRIQATQASLAVAKQTAQRLYLDAQFGAIWRQRHDPDWQATVKAAMSDCTRAIEIEPNIPEAYAVRARLFYLRGDRESARRDVQKALELDPELSLARRILGMLYLVEGRFEPALDNYDRGMRDGEGIAEDYHNRGRLRRIAGQYQLALQDHNRAVSLEPSESMAYLGRGMARYFVGDIDGAIEDFSRVAAMQPESATAMQMNIWMWEMRMLRNGPGDRKAGKAALATSGKAVGGPISAALLEVCGGKKPIEEVLGGLTVPGASDDEIECVVSYCAAIRAMIDDRPADAETFFQRCRQTKAINQPEYDMADWHLKKLAAK